MKQTISFLFALFSVALAYNCVAPNSTVNTICCSYGNDVTVSGSGLSCTQAPNPTQNPQVTQCGAFVNCEDANNYYLSSCISSSCSYVNYVLPGASCTAGAVSVCSPGGVTCPSSGFCPSSNASTCTFGSVPCTYSQSTTSWGTICHRDGTCGAPFTAGSSSTCTGDADCVNSAGCFGGNCVAYFSLGVGQNCSRGGFTFDSLCQSNLFCSSVGTCQQAPYLPSSTSITKGQACNLDSDCNIALTGLGCICTGTTGSSTCQPVSGNPDVSTFVNYVNCLDTNYCYPWHADSYFTDVSAPSSWAFTYSPSTCAQTYCSGQAKAFLQKLLSRCGSSSLAVSFAVLLFAAFSLLFL